jgi:hypothetical protein
MITEVKPMDGTVEVRPANATDWRRGVPLQALEIGDTIRVTRKARAIVMYANSRTTVAVTAALSPYTVKSPEKKNSQEAKAQALLGDITGFLAGKKRNSLTGPMAVREMLSMPLAVRGSVLADPAQPPHILSPAQSLLRNGTPVIEWSGSPKTVYAVRILDGKRLIWERSGLTRTRLEYPPDAAPLEEGKRYTVVIQAGGSTPASAWVQVATASELADLQGALTLLEKTMSPALPPSSRTALLFGALASRGYWADAREKALAALAADSDDPLLHVLMGDYYAQIGLTERSAEEYNEANFLLEVKR